MSHESGAVDASKKRKFISPRELIEESRYDLELAELILKYRQFKPEKCESDKDTFYLGRRALYLLQQAVEKATKAYYLALFKVAVDRLADLAQLSRKVNPRARGVEKKLRKLSRGLEPSQVSHAPHRVLIDLLKVLNKAENREVIAFLMEYISNYLSKGFEKLKAQHPQIKQEIEEVEAWIIEYVRNALAIYRKSKPVEFKTPENIQRVPPCIISDVLKDLKELRCSELEQIIDIGEKKLREVIEHFRTIKPSLIKVLTSMSKINTSEAENLVDSYLVLARALRSILFSNYLASFITYVCPCLQWYEEGGRYPDSKVQGLVLVSEKQKEICIDLANTEPLIEEVRYIVEKVEKAIEEYELLLFPLISQEQDYTTSDEDDFI